MVGTVFGGVVPATGGGGTAMDFRVAMAGIGDGEDAYTIPP
jgi:hypothetical protein